MTRLPFPYLTENKPCQNAVFLNHPTGVLASDWAPRTRREVFCLGACLIFDNPPPAGHTKNDRRSAPKIGFVRSFFMRLPSRDPCTKAHTPAQSNHKDYEANPIRPLFATNSARTS